MSHCSMICQSISLDLDRILSYRNHKKQKADGSYVSKGDLLVQEIVFAYCNEHLSGYTLISEEFAPFENSEWNSNGDYVVLDPIDGTENFISGLKEWGVGISIYEQGQHKESCIFLPELNELAITDTPQPKYQSRIHGLSSSLSKQDLEVLPEGFEYRIIGCSMYNMLAAVRGSYARFENVKGVNCWDILPGLNLALENNIAAYVDGEPYQGQILFPTRKYKIVLETQ